VNNANYEAPHFVIVSILLLLPSSLVQNIPRYDINFILSFGRSKATAFTTNKG